MRLFAFTLPFLLAVAAGPVAAQDRTAPDRGLPKSGAPKESAKPKPPQRASLDELYDRLANAKDETEGNGIAALIQRRWSRSGSDTADLLMGRAGQAAESKDFPLAVELLDRVVTLEPKWAEAWYRRANVFYQMDDPVGAMADIRKVLELEPHHFGAWAGLGHIFMAAEDKSHALEAYRRALKIHPQFSAVQTLVERLTPQVDGQDL